MTSTQAVAGVSPEISPSPLEWFHHTQKEGVPIEPSKKYHLRRAHKKSRGGCFSCKRRRVKCDEKRPACDRCSSGKWSCVYADSVEKSHSAKTLPTQLSEVEFLRASFEAISAAHGWQCLSSSSVYIELLSDFRTHTVKTVSSPMFQETLAGKSLSLAQEHSFFLHAILAFAASHRTCAGSHDDFGAIAVFHTQKALEVYSQRLPRVKDRLEMDAMVASCFLLTALFYLSHEQLGTTEDWINGGHYSVGKAYWSTTLSGPPLLLKSMLHTKSAGKSIWSSFTDDSYRSVLTAVAKAGPGGGLVRLLYEICHDIAGAVADDFEKDCTPAELYMPVLSRMDAALGMRIATLTQDATPANPYLPALHKLIPIINLHYEPETSTFTPCTEVASYVLLMAFPSGFNAAFKERLSKRDSIALLLVGFWFALLAKLHRSQWWLLRRARSEGRAILLHFDGAQFLCPKMTKAVSILRKVLTS